VKRRHPLQLPEDEEEALRAAVKRHCLDCSGAYYEAIRDRYHRPEEECDMYSCPLYPYALGVTKRNRPDKWGEHLQRWVDRQRQMWG